MGRYIVFTLILANLVFFLWNYSQPMVVSERKPAEIPADVQPLTLLHEKALKGKQRSAADAQTAPQPDGAERLETGVKSTDVERLASGFGSSEIEATEPQSGSEDRTVATNARMKPTPGEARRAAEEGDRIEQEDRYVAALDEKVAEDSEEKAKRPDEVHCYTLGPFMDRQVAETSAAEIKAIGFPVAQRAIEEREVKHYWIYLPPFKSDQEAQKASRKLAKNGIKDYFIVTTDENRNAISLGLFKKQTGAKRRSRRIRELGFKPKIEVRYRNRTYYWLDYEETGDYPLPSQIWQSIETDNGPIQRITRDCT